MDPNVLLQEIRDLKEITLSDLDANSDPEVLADTLRSLAEKIDALDVHMYKGGFLPEAWARNR